MIGASGVPFGRVLVGNGPLHVGVAPVADAGFLVRRNVGAPHLVGWPVPLLRTARELPVHGKGTRRTTRSMAIAAGQKAVHQVAAALDWWLRLRQRRGRQQSCNP